MDTVYLDNAATTCMRPEVLEAMLPYFCEEYGNPSSIYDLGQEASDAVARSRKTIAEAIGAQGKEVYFTASGTEADNWAIKGFMRANATKGKHIITSAIEHHAVLHSCQALEKEGFEVTYLPVNGEGLVSVDDFEAAIRPDTILATIIFANNEIGTIQPIRELAVCAHAHGVTFHTDAVQAFAHEAIDVNDLGIDMMKRIRSQTLWAEGRGVPLHPQGLARAESYRRRAAGRWKARSNRERPRHRGFWGSRSLGNDREGVGTRAPDGLARPGHPADCLQRCPTRG